MPNSNLQLRTYAQKFERILAIAVPVFEELRKIIWKAGKSSGLGRTSLKLMHQYWKLLSTIEVRIEKYCTKMYHNHSLGGGFIDTVHRNRASEDCALINIQPSFRGRVAEPGIQCFFGKILDSSIQECGEITC